MNTACPSCLKRVGVRGGNVAPHFRAGSRSQTCSASGAPVGAKRGPGRPRKPGQVRIELRLPAPIAAALDRKRGVLDRASFVALLLESCAEPGETVRQRLGRFWVDTMEPLGDVPRAEREGEAK